MGAEKSLLRDVVAKDISHGWRISTKVQSRLTSGGGTVENRGGFKRRQHSKGRVGGEKTTKPVQGAKVKMSWDWEIKCRKAKDGLELQRGGKSGASRGTQVVYWEMLLRKTDP